MSDGPTIRNKILARIHLLLDNMGESNPREMTFMAQAVKELYLSLNLENENTSVDWMKLLEEEEQPRGPRPLNKEKDND
tara:strand:+ start:1384 stop:1620 length:237 start_codon:yes stop_codon:yes gene_type:complete